MVFDNPDGHVGIIVGRVVHLWHHVNARVKVVPHVVFLYKYTVSSGLRTSAYVQHENVTKSECERAREREGEGERERGREGESE